MSPKLGYLLPTRENIMRGEPSGRALVDAARHVADLGFDSVWVGDSLLARPRHEPLTLLAAVAGAVDSIELGTAVLLPALRNPVVLAHQLATLDQVSEGRLIVGAGIAGDNPAIRHEFAAAGVAFEGRVGLFMEGFRLCKALWSGEPVDWEGRWQMQDAVLAPTPYRPGGPPIWIGTGHPNGIMRTAKHFDGWFPISPNPEQYAEMRQQIFAVAAEAGRDASAFGFPYYMTVCIDDDADAANQAINDYLAEYYGVPGEVMRRIQSAYGGPLDGALDYIRSFTERGVDHVVLRLVGDHAAQLESFSRVRDELL